MNELRDALYRAVPGDHKEVPRAPAVPHPRRGIENTYLVAQAQSIYDPSMPPVPPRPEKPNAKMVQLGVSGTLGTSGSWGQPAPRGAES